MIYGYTFHQDLKFGKPIRSLVDAQAVIDFVKFSHVGTAKDATSDNETSGPVALWFEGYGLDDYIIYGQICSTCGKPFMPDFNTDIYCKVCNGV